jgi:hypothetical protein
LGIQSVSGTSTSQSQSSTDYSYIYVDKDVTIIGADQNVSPPGTVNGDGTPMTYDYSTTVNLSLKAGWNVVETVSSYSGKLLSDGKIEAKSTTTYSVKGIPESAKWTLDSRG